MAKSRRTRVLIVDDHAVVRQGLRTFLELQPDLEIVGEAGDGAAAVAAAAAKKPDVVLMDLVMPVMDGVEATRRIRAEAPEVRVIVLTSFAGEDKVFPALRSGAAGYLLKDVKPADLADTIRAVARGESRLAPDVQKQLVSGIAGSSAGGAAAATEALTAREEEVLRCLARGRSNKEIAADLFIAEKTVKTHVGSVLGKLQVENRAQAIVQALRRHGFNRLAAARDLGIHKSTLFRKIRKYRIALPEIDGRSGGKESP